MKASFCRLLAFVALFWATPVFAHKPSDSYLRLELTNQIVRGEWQIALRDLDLVLGLDANQDLAVTWGELKAQQRAISDYAFAHFTVRGDGSKVALQLTDFHVDKHSDGSYAVLRFAATQPVKGAIEIGYNFLFDIDAQHRGILFLSAQSGPDCIFKPNERSYLLDPVASATAAPFKSIVVEGVWHIWKGFDHLLFLLTLILPTVIRREGSGWRVADEFRPVFWQVAKVVTAFTVAHSITLALAALEIVKLPSVFIESVIAASVVVAALNNLYPFLSSKTWLVAFGFGLIHGFGFANVFADLGISGAGILLPLFAFNLGVELGQLAVVGAFLPLAYVFRRSPRYRVIGVQGASVAVAIIATTWTFERILDFKVLPF